MPFDVPYQDRCPFCAFLARERPFAILEENTLTSILVTFEQVGPGHVLVIPTQHRETILDLTDEEAHAVMETTRRAVRAIVAAYDPPGVNVWQNNGVPARQTVPHVHVHVAGAPPGGTSWDREVPRLSLAETERIAAELRPHL